MFSTVATSSSTVGFSARSGEVRQSVSISDSSRRSFSASVVPPMFNESRSATRSAIRRIERATARRRASVGWAVNTGRNSTAPSRARASSGPTSAASWAYADPRESSGASSSAAIRDSRSRSTRTRWYSSARFARWK
jgi:hypothetical protein